MNSVPDNYVSSKVVFVQPLQMQFRKSPYIPNNETLAGEYMTTFIFSVSHLTGKVFTFKDKYPIDKK